MKVKIFWDDWRVYSIEDTPFFGERDTEIPDELYERYSKALADYVAVQDILDNLYREKLHQSSRNS